MNKLLRNLKLFVQFAFYKIIFMWATAILNPINSLVLWAASGHNRILSSAQKLLLQEEHKKDVDMFIKKMQREAKIIGLRPNKDNEQK